MKTPMHRSFRSFRTLFCWATIIGLFAAGPATATVYVVGPSGSLQQILDEVTVTLADGDAIYVPASAGALGEMTQSTLIDHDLTLYGDGPGLSVVKPVSTPVRFATVKSSLTVKGLTFEGFTEAFDLYPALSQQAAVFRALDIEVRDGDEGIVSSEHGSLAGVLSRVEIKDSSFTDLDGAAIYIGTRSLDSADVTGNHIENVGLAGILLGNQGVVGVTQKSQHLIIAQNHIQGVAGRPLGNFANRNFGIAAFGRQVVISDNVLRDLDREIDTSQFGDVYAAIYTKASYAVVRGNVISNPGTGYVIDLKGESRNGTSNVSGYGSIVANNQILIADPGNLRYSGIKTNVEDVTIQGNHIEGASQEAILVQTQATDDVSILGNTTFLGTHGAGFGHGVQVQTDERLAGSLGAGDRRLLIMGNRFVGYAAGDDIVNRVFQVGAIAWQELTLPVAAGEWVVEHNIRH